MNKRETNGGNDKSPLMTRFTADSPTTILLKIQCFWILPFDLELIYIKLDKHLTFPHLTLTVDYIYRAGHCQERNDDSFLIYLSGPIPWAHQQDIRPHNKDNTVTEEKSV